MEFVGSLNRSGCWWWGREKSKRTRKILIRTDVRRDMFMYRDSRVVVDVFFLGVFGWCLMFVVWCLDLPDESRLHSLLSFALSSNSLRRNATLGTTRLVLIRHSSLWNNVVRSTLLPSGDSGRPDSNCLVRSDTMCRAPGGGERTRLQKERENDI